MKNHITFDISKTPFYCSHKVVRAAKIVGMNDDKSHICTDDGTNWTNIAGPNKPDPEVGWYVVLYPDGYVSFSPAQQFLEGYSAWEEAK